MSVGTDDFHALDGFEKVETIVHIVYLKRIALVVQIIILIWAFYIIFLFFCLIETITKLIKNVVISLCRLLSYDTTFFQQIV